MNGSFLPDDDKDTDRTAWAISLGLFTALASALCGASFLLARLIDAETADLIVGIPGFFAVFILMPVQAWAKQHLLTRRCVRGGGHYLVPITPGSAHAQCGSCGRVVADAFDPSTPPPVA